MMDLFFQSLWTACTQAFESQTVIKLYCSLDWLRARVDSKGRGIENVKGDIAGPSLESESKPYVERAEGTHLHRRPTR
jgi:hypothetical protein